MRISIKAKRAALKAAEAVRNGTDKPKRKKKPVVQGLNEPKYPTIKWIEDPKQGCVFFDGFHYWLTKMEGNDIIRVGLTEDEYLHPRRKKKVENNVKVSKKSNNSVATKKGNKKKRKSIVSKPKNAVRRNKKKMVRNNADSGKRKVRSDKGKKRIKK